MLLKSELSATCILAATLFPTGCGTQVPPPTTDVVYEDNGLTYVLRGKPTHCSDSTTRVVSQVAELADWLGVKPPPIRYELFEDLDALRDNSPCSHFSGGCAAEGVVYSIAGADTHELVHAVAAAIGTPPKFLSEGLAVMFSEPFSSQDTFLVPELVGDLDLVDALTDDGWQRGAATDVSSIYKAASGFARYLVDTFGKEKYLALYAGLRRGASRDEVEKAFGDALGQSASDTVATWRSWPTFGSETRFWLVNDLPSVEASGPAKEASYDCASPRPVKFAHSKSRRTVLHVSGDANRSFDIQRARGGSVTGGLRLRLGATGSVIVALDGPADDLLVVSEVFGPPIAVTLEDRALDEEVIETEEDWLVLGPSPAAHSPMCFSPNVSISDEGSSIQTQSFLTGRPKAFECCQGADCQTEPAWTTEPVTFACEPASCIQPGPDFPSAWTNAIPAADAVGRVTLYRAHLGAP